MTKQSLRSNQFRLNVEQCPNDIFVESPTIRFEIVTYDDNNNILTKEYYNGKVNNTLVGELPISFFNRRAHITGAKCTNFECQYISSNPNKGQEIISGGTINLKCK